MSLKWARSFFIVKAAVLTLTLALPAAQALTLNLDMNSLPSSQGWNYMALGNAAAESQVFSVGGGALHQNTLGLGNLASGGNRYNLFDQLTPGVDYALAVRAQLTGSELETNVNHWAFGAGWFDGTGGSFGFGLGGAGVITPWSYTLLDTSVAHDYLMIGHAAANANPAQGELWVDGLFVSGGLAFDYGSCAPLGILCNSVYIGDGTGGPNASGDYFSLSLTSINDVPEPGSALLVLAALAGLAGAGVMRRRS